MPVVLAGLEEDTVAGTDHLDRAALALAEADAFGHPDRLAERVRMPGGACARCEVHGGGTKVPVAFGRGDHVEVDRPGEPVRGAGAGVERVACDLHVCAFQSWIRIVPSELATAGSVWSRKSDAPVSSVAMRCISSASSSKSNTSKFSRIRSGRTDFGMTTTSRWISQRRTTCATDFPCAAAISDNVGSVKRLLRPSANGPHDSVRMPRSRMISWSAVRWKNGWHSTWLTAGVISLCSIRSTSLSG